MINNWVAERRPFSNNLVAIYNNEYCVRKEEGGTTNIYLGMVRVAIKNQY